MIANKRIFAVEIATGFIKLLIAGLLIGILKPHDGFIAFLLGLKVAFNIYYNVIKPKKERNWILLIGMIITGIGGIIGEIWGVSNGYWTYTLVNRALPLWLPFAWMLAFYFLYKLECRILPTLSNPNNQRNKIILAIVIALIFPAFGEMVTIYMGVWTYFWPYQLFGVPLYAFLCLVGLHMLIYLILHLICKKYQISDIVYN